MIGQGRNGEEEELITELKAENKRKKENSRCSRAFKKIQVTSKFAGAKVFVYRLQEEDDVTDLRHLYRYIHLQFW